MSIGSSMQLERVGFFVVDADSTNERLVLNRIVELRESNTKKNVADAYML